MPATFDAVDRLMQTGVDQKVFPGAVLWVAGEGRTLFEKAYGWADLFFRRAMTSDTVFDLSSLTKPLATTLAVMHLVQRGLLDLDQTLEKLWPQWGDGGKLVTPRKLLSHTAGLAPWRPFFMKLKRIPRLERMGLLRRWLFEEPLRIDSIGEYSDLGFMLLQRLVEEKSGLPLDRYLAESIYSPLELRGLFFINLDHPVPDVPYAATELCPWRGRLLIGEVHDDNANVLGGVAGHAGLFGSAAAVGNLLNMLLLAENTTNSRFLLRRSLITAFFQKQPDTGWALGFDTPTHPNSSSGRLFSPGSVGHLGFTGTSFWMDRRRQIIVVLLTNRVHPFRYNPRIKEFRPRLHDEIMITFK